MYDDHVSLFPSEVVVEGTTVLHFICCSPKFWKTKNRLWRTNFKRYYSSLDHCSFSTLISLLGLDQQTVLLKSRISMNLNKSIKNVFAKPNPLGAELFMQKCLWNPSSLARKFPFHKKWFNKVKAIGQKKKMFFWKVKFYSCNSIVLQLKKWMKSKKNFSFFSPEVLSWQVLFKEHENFFQFRWQSWDDMKQQFTGNVAFSTKQFDWQRCATVEVKKKARNRTRMIIQKPSFDVATSAALKEMGNKWLVH